jgi:D-glycero-D-manno-heptose 1,7-bisphosphate phosphatase
MKKAAFLDRDGVINDRAVEGSYITKWEEFHILPGVAESVALLNGAGFCVVIVTNQRCIAKGLITMTELEILHERMVELLARSGAAIDRVYYCPHELDASCECRKPRPGMLLEAARANDIELSSSWMIGDSDIDIDAGRNAGCKTARILATGGTNEKSGQSRIARIPADIETTSLLDAVKQIISSPATSQCVSQPSSARETRQV